MKHKKDAKGVNKSKKSTSSKSSGGFLGSRKILRQCPFTLNNIPSSF
jgi:hypothetical protein